MSLLESLRQKSHEVRVEQVGARFRGLEVVKRRLTRDMQEQADRGLVAFQFEPHRYESVTVPELKAMFPGFDIRGFEDEISISWG